MRKWGTILVVVALASVMMWKSIHHPHTVPSQFAESRSLDASSKTETKPESSGKSQPVSSSANPTKSQTDSQSKSQGSAGTSFQAFRSLVEQSREQSKKCKEDLKAAIEGLSELKGQDPDAVRAELSQRLKDLGKVPLYPRASQQALQMIENGVPSDWDGELLSSELGQFGDCTPFEHYDAIKNLIDDSEQWNDSLKDEVVKATAEFLKNGMDAPVPLIINLVRIDVLDKLRSSGYIDMRFASKIKELQNESQTLKAKLVEQGKKCSEHPESECSSGYPYEIANSKSIHEHYRALVSEAFTN
jgi:hypothetical protein